MPSRGGGDVPDPSEAVNVFHVQAGGASHPKVFQSLLCWIGLLGLVVAPEDDAVAAQVSILVVLDRPPRPDALPRLGRGGPVSILVVLDRPPRQAQGLT